MDETIRRTTILSNKQAAKIQRDHDVYNCVLIELGIVDTMTARIVIEGTETDISNLLDATKN